MPVMKSDYSVTVLHYNYALIFSVGFVEGRGKTREKRECKEECGSNLGGGGMVTCIDTVTINLLFAVTDK